MYSHTTSINMYVSTCIYIQAGYRMLAILLTVFLESFSFLPAGAGDSDWFFALERVSSAAAHKLS